MKSKLLSRLFVLLIVFVPILSRGQTVGTLSALKTAISNAGPGTVIKLENKTYSGDMYFDVNKSGASGNLITIQAETPGGVKFTGNVEIKVSGSYVKLAGIDIDGAKLKKRSLIADPSKKEHSLIHVTGNNNVFEDLRIKNVTNNDNIRSRYLFFHDGAANNHVIRCWFQKDSSSMLGPMCYGSEKSQNVTVENCYFKSVRGVDPLSSNSAKVNGNGAMRMGRGKITGGVIGNHTIKNNLFDEANGEDEIVSLKSSGNVLEGNTFLNSQGIVSCRHYPNNTIKNNYFINQDGHNDQGATVDVWGRDHKVLNNYFYRPKSRIHETGGAINLRAGAESHIEAYHEKVTNCLVQDNIIYEAQTVSNPAKKNNAITLGSNYRVDNNNAANSTTIMPTGVTVKGNLIYKSTDEPQIAHVKSGVGVTYQNNKVYKKSGFTTLPSGISETDPNLQSEILNTYTVHKSGSKGPQGTGIKPLVKNDVGPLWLRTNVLVSGVTVSPASLTLEVDDTATLSKTVLPSTASNKSVTWSSDDESIATVDQNGKVTAKKVGNTKIRAKANDASGKEGTCAVEVKASGGGGSTTTYKETFEKLNVNNANGDWVTNEDFSGDVTGVTWVLNAKKVSQNFTVESGSKSIYFVKNKVGIATKAKVSGGIGTLKLKAKNMWSSNQPRRLELWINGELKGIPHTNNGSNTSTSYTVDFGTINVAGDVKIEIKNASVPTSSTEPCSIGIDDIEWTTYSGSTTPDTTPPAAPTNLSASSIEQTKLTLNWTAPGDNDVASYSIEKKVDGVTTTVVEGHTSSSYPVTGLLAGKTYEFTVKAKDQSGNVSEASQPKSVTTLAATLNYCASKGNNANYEYISKVKVGTIDNTSGKAGYTDFTSLSTDLAKGSSYPITINATFPSGPYQEAYKVWIDFNRDGVFHNTDEKVWDHDLTTATSVSGSITIPSGVSEGTTRMRVSMKYEGVPTPCETFAYGEVEDYTVVIKASGARIGQKDTPDFDQEPLESSVSIYPNPVRSNDLLTIQLSGIDQVSKADAKIIDLTGQTLLTAPRLDLKNNTIVLNVRLAAGTYVLVVEAGERILNQKLIVK